MKEVQDHGVELVSSVVSAGEAGEIVFGIFGFELLVGSCDGASGISRAPPTAYWTSFPMSAARSRASSGMKSGTFWS